MVGSGALLQSEIVASFIFLLEAHSWLSYWFTQCWYDNLVNRSEIVSAASGKSSRSSTHPKNWGYIFVGC